MRLNETFFIRMQITITQFINLLKYETLPFTEATVNYL